MLTNNEKLVLEKILEKPGLGQVQLCAEINLARETVKKALKSLENEGAIVDQAKASQHRGAKSEWVIKNKSEAKRLIHEATYGASLKRDVDEGRLESIQIPFSNLLGKALKELNGIGVEEAAAIGSWAEKYPLVSMTMSRHSSMPNPDELIKHWSKLDWLLLMLILQPIGECWIQKKKPPNMDDLRKLSYKIIIDVDFSNLPPETDEILSKTIPYIFEKLKESEQFGRLVEETLRRKESQDIREETSKDTPRRVENR